MSIFGAGVDGERARPAALVEQQELEQKNGGLQRLKEHVAAIDILGEKPNYQQLKTIDPAKFRHDYQRAKIWVAQGLKPIEEQVTCIDQCLAILAGWSEGYGLEVYKKPGLSSLSNPQRKALLWCYQQKLAEKAQSSDKGHNSKKWPLKLSCDLDAKEVQQQADHLSILLKTATELHIQTEKIVSIPFVELLTQLKQELGEKFNIRTLMISQSPMPPVLLKKLLEILPLNYYSVLTITDGALTDENLFVFLSFIQTHKLQLITLRGNQLSYENLLLLQKTLSRVHHESDCITVCETDITAKVREAEIKLSTVETKRKIEEYRKALEDVKQREVKQDLDGYLRKIEEDLSSLEARLLLQDHSKEFTITKQLLKDIYQLKLELLEKQLATVSSHEGCNRLIQNIEKLAQKIEKDGFSTPANTIKLNHLKLQVLKRHLLYFVSRVSQYNEIFNIKLNEFLAFITQHRENYGCFSEFYDAIAEVAKECVRRIDNVQSRYEPIPLPPAIPPILISRLSTELRCYSEMTEYSAAIRARKGEHLTAEDMLNQINARREIQKEQFFEHHKNQILQRVAEAAGIKLIDLSKMASITEYYSPLGMLDRITQTKDRQALAAVLADCYNALKDGKNLKEVSSFSFIEGAQRTYEKFRNRALIKELEVLVTQHPLVGSHQITQSDAKHIPVETNGSGQEPVEGRPNGLSFAVAETSQPSAPTPAEMSRQPIIVASGETSPDAPPEQLSNGEEDPGYDLSERLSKSHSVADFAMLSQAEWQQLQPGLDRTASAAQLPVIHAPIVAQPNKVAAQLVPAAVGVSREEGQPAGKRPVGSEESKKQVVILSPG